MPQDRKITDSEGVSYDMFNVHAFSETWIKKNLFFSAGYMFTNLDNDLSGSRIYGDDFDVNYSPNAGNGLGYTNLVGSSQKTENVLNLNLMAMPTESVHHRAFGAGAEAGLGREFQRHRDAGHQHRSPLRPTATAISSTSASGWICATPA